jgi:hypothetical protein
LNVVGAGKSAQSRCQRLFVARRQHERKDDEIRDRLIDDVERFV